MYRQAFKGSIQTRALSGVYGKIVQLLLAYPGKKANVTKSLVLERYEELFRAFSDRVVFVIMGHFGDSEEVLREAKAAFADAMLAVNLNPGHQLIFCHTPFAGGRDLDKLDVHSEFIQDPFLVMETEYGTTVLLEPMRQNNPENRRLAEQLCCRADFLLQPCEVEIEGGNILVGDDFALVGENIFHRNLALGLRLGQDAPRKAITSRLKKLLGVTYLVWIGRKEPVDMQGFHSTGREKRQPFFHLDHFLTLAGKANEGQEIVLVARIDLVHVSGASPEEKVKLREINSLLDEVESEMENNPQGLSRPPFRIIRVDMGGKVIGTKKHRKFVPYGYNNAHVEIFQGIRRIYLPAYTGMEKLEDRLQNELRRSARFDSIRFISNAFEAYSAKGGSLHCISTVLSRKY